MDIKIEVSGDALVQNATLTKNKDGLHFLIINMMDRWPDYERLSGITEDKENYIEYSFEKDNLKSSVKILNFNGDFKAFEELEKDQFIVTYVPTDLLLKREEVICSSK